MSDKEPLPENQLLGDDDRLAIRNRLKILEDKARKIKYLAEDIEKEIHQVWWSLMYPPNNPKNVGTLKRGDGRLNDAGIAAINAAFEGNTSVTEVAKKFDISQSAASNRKKIWLMEKAKALTATSTKDQS